ncbi:hypothetical protein JWJ90_05965 [Desulfobulbus rhabdoformis]|uniref:hypothetical protein n=1 Tax=Desulfobulbus rhabdoformis TaxID=34032 RepID=UPI001965916F|nr:hypothetical protein [Desulfobulbus rhabdoformis]MBM9613832.1 hypothetical protein [Desulfobulbus rhabdoformis]
MFLFSCLRRYTGWLILATLFFFLLSQLIPPLFFVVVILSWSVVLIEWGRLPASSRRQAFLLGIGGFIALLFAAWHGVFLGIEKISTQNLQLLPMFIAVSFLALTNPPDQDDTLPQGKKAMLTTAVGTNLLGAVINLSILFVFGDRLARNHSLSKGQSILLARSFCAAAWWSPFFIAAGVALTYAPEMHYHRILLPGLLMSGLALSYSIIEVGYIRKLTFTGYPVRRESLTVPILLALAVISGHALFPHLSMIMIICLVSPPAAILFMRPRPRLQHLHEFISTRITATVSQFVLFLAAGLFSIGMTSVIQVAPEIFTFGGETFTHSTFALVSALLIGLGLIGVHPLVGISVISPLLLPMHPDHSRLGFLFLTSWAVSTGSSPLSGVGLILSSRYQIAPRSILVNNFPYVISLWLLANLVNVIYFG